MLHVAGWSKKKSLPKLLVALGLAAGVVASLAMLPAEGASGDGKVTVHVVRTYSGSGTYDPILDTDLAGVTVKISDAAGTVVSLATDATGVATLPAGDTRLSGGTYRVDVVNPNATLLQPAPAATTGAPSATKFSTNTEFVNVAGGTNASVITAFWNPHDYCQSNPLVANACQPAVFAHGDPNPQLGASPTVFVTPYQGDNASNPSGGTNSSTGYSDSVDVAGFQVKSDSVKTGAVYGIAYNRSTKMIFAGAYAKRNSLFGPAGPGGIYLIDPATGATSVFTTVPNAAPAADLLAAPWGHSVAPSVGNVAIDEDIQFAPKVGKESLGAIVVSDDFSKLFVVNQYDKKVYVYDATQPTALLPLTTIDVSANPGCAAAGDWRPMGLGTNEGTLYVGGVCSGEVEAAAATPQDPYPGTLKAIVLTYNQTSYASTGKVLDQSLNFNKGDHAGPNSVCPGSHGGWFAWNDAAWCADSGAMAASQPMLGKILVEASGNLDLGFRDRFGDQIGKFLALPVVGTGGPTTYSRFDSPVAEGDTNLACPDGSGMFVMDANGGCGKAAVTPGNPVNHYYDVQGLSPHPRGMFAGMTMSRSEKGLIQNHIDATSTYNSQGLSVLDRRGSAFADPYNQLIVEGSYPVTSVGAGSGVIDANKASFGKAQGLADMDVLCDLAPIQIGNHVWVNSAGDGQENPGEVAVAGVTVNLYDAAGNKMATTTTDARGNYLFDSRTTAALKPNTAYSIKLDNPADYATGGPLDKGKYTLTVAGDNKGAYGADSFPALTLTTGAPGADNHTYDFGFKPISAIHIVKFDGRLTSSPVPPATAHADNTQNPVAYGLTGLNTGPQPVKMIVTNTGTTPLSNVTVSDKTLSAPDMTGLSCDFSALGGPSSGTTWAWAAGGTYFQPGASFPCTGSVNLKLGDHHVDTASVVGTQVDPATGALQKPVVSDSDSYAAVVHQPAIHIVKFDGRLQRSPVPSATDHADNRKAPVEYGIVRKTTGQKPIKMIVTNTGSTALSNVTVVDKKLSPPKMTGLTCDFSALGGPKSGVTWAWKSGGKVFQPGDSFPCYGFVEMSPGQHHVDVASVVGTEVDKATGKLLTRKVQDQDYYAAVVYPPELLPNTGGPSRWLPFLGGVLVVGGLALMVRRRRSANV